MVDDSNSTCVDAALDLVAYGQLAFAPRSTREEHQDHDDDNGSGHGNGAGGSSNGHGNNGADGHSLLRRALVATASTSNSTPNLSTICTSQCYSLLVSRLRNMSDRILDAIVATDLAEPFNGTNLPTAVEQADLLCDLRTLAAIGHLPALMVKRCARELGNATFCAIGQGNDYVLPDAEDGPAAAFDFVSALSASQDALCSSCGVYAVDTTVAQARFVLRLWKALGGAHSRGFVALELRDPAAAFGLFEMVAASTAIVYVAPELAPLCGLGPHGVRCGRLAETTSLAPLAACTPYFGAAAHGNTSWCPAGCSAAIASLQTQLGCCFAPTLALALNNPLHHGVAGGWGVNISTMASLAEACGVAPSDGCAATRITHFVFRLLNIEYSALVEGLRSSFDAAVITDVAAILNVNSSSITVASIADGGVTDAGVASVIITVDVLAPSDDTAPAVSSAAVSLVSSGSTQFLAVNEFAESSQTSVLSNPNVVISADTTGASSSIDPPSTSGAVSTGVWSSLGVASLLWVVLLVVPGVNNA